MTENITEIRKKPGESNAGKYKGVKSSNFAGPNGTYPINTEKRAKAALSYAHNSPKENSIKEKVYKKYPGLAERHKERTHEKMKGQNDKKKYDAYKSR